MTSEESADVEDEESSIDAGEQPPPQSATAAGPPSSLPHTPSTEDLSAKKKPPSRIAASGLRAPTAGKSELMWLLSYCCWICGSGMDLTSLLILLFLFLFVFLLERPLLIKLKAPSFQMGLGWNLARSIDGVRFSFFWRDTFKMAAVTSFHSEKYSHLVSGHAVCQACMCSSVGQFCQ